MTPIQFPYLNGLAELVFLGTTVGAVLLAMELPGKLGFLFGRRKTPGDVRPEPSTARGPEGAPRSPDPQPVTETRPLPEKIPETCDGERPDAEDSPESIPPVRLQDPEESFYVEQEITFLHTREVIPEAP